MTTGNTVIARTPSRSCADSTRSVRALVRGNWIRTVAWTLRATVALALAISAMG